MDVLLLRLIRGRRQFEELRIANFESRNGKQIQKAEVQRSEGSLKNCGLRISNCGIEGRRQKAEVKGQRSDVRKQMKH